MRRARILPGRIYKRDEHGTTSIEITNLPRIPDVVVCRRRSDFPADKIPKDAAFSACVKCGEIVVHNPRGPFKEIKKHCMQCEDIIPEEL